MKKIVVTKEDKKEEQNINKNIKNDNIKMETPKKKEKKTIVSNKKVKTITIGVNDVDGNYKLQEDSKCFKTTKGKFTSCFAKSLDDKELVKLSKNNHNLSLSFLGKKSSIKKLHKVEGKVLSSSKEKSSISFENFENGLDLNYEVHSRGIKESIVVRDKQDDYTFNFAMNIGGLTPRYNDETKCIELCVNDDVVYKILSPFMQDSKGELSNDCSYEIEQDGEVLNLTLKADAEWINSNERVLPVIIDPTIEVVETSSLSVVQYGAPLSEFGIFPEDVLVVGIEERSTGPTWSVRVTLSKDKILSSIKNLNKIYLNFTVHSFSSFHYKEDYLHVTHNNKNYQSVPLKEIDNKSSFNLDITQLILESTENTIVFNITATDKFPTSIHSYICFYKSTNKPTEPKIIVEYNTEESNTNTNTHTNTLENKYPVGRAGATFVNLKTGFFRHTHQDTSLTHNSLSLNINHIFDSNVFNDEKNGILPTFMGKGWRTNLHQYLLKSNYYNEDLESKDVIYTDGNGKTHTFHQRWYYNDLDNIKHYVSNDAVYIGTDQQLKYCDSNKKVWNVKVDFASENGLTLITSESVARYKSLEDLDLLTSLGLKLKNTVIKLDEIDKINHIYKVPVFNTINGTQNYEDIIQLDDNSFVFKDNTPVEVKYQSLSLLLNENGYYFNATFQNPSAPLSFVTREVCPVLYFEFNKNTILKDYIDTEEIVNINSQIKQLEANISSLYWSYVILKKNIDLCERQLNLQQKYYNDDAYEKLKTFKKFYEDSGYGTLALKLSIEGLTGDKVVYNDGTNMLDFSEIGLLNDLIESKDKCQSYIQAFSNYMQILTNKLDETITSFKLTYSDSVEDYDLFAYIEQLESYNIQLEQYLKNTNENLKNIRFLEDKRQNLINEQKRNVNDIILCDNGTILGFDGYGRLINVQDVYENNINIEYGYEDENEGKLLSISAEQQIAKFNYDKDTGLLKTIIDPRGRKTKFEYNKNTELISIKYNDGKITRFTYDESFSVVSPRLENNKIIRNKEDDSISVRTYCLNGYFNKDTILLGNEATKNVIDHRYTFDECSNSTIITDEKNKDSITYFFDSNDNVIKQEEVNMTKVALFDDKLLKSKAEYKTYNNVERKNSNPVIDSLTIYSDPYTYSFALSKVDMPISNMLGLKLNVLEYAATEPNLTLKIKITVTSDNPKKEIFEQEYQDIKLQNCVLPICVNRNYSSNLTIEIFNSDLNKFIESIDLIKLESGTIYTYDEKEHLIKEQDGYNTIIYEDYNDDNIPLKITKSNIYGEEVITNYSYNSQNKLTNIEDNKGNVLEYYYNEKGQCVEKRSYNKKDASLINVEKITYDEQGRVLSSQGPIKDLNGNYPTEEINYLPNTNVQNKIKGLNGETTCYNYDFNTGDLLSISSSASGINNSTSFTYNYGLLTSLSNHGIKVDYTYDGRGRKNQIDLNGKSLFRNFYIDNYNYKDNDVEITNGLLFQTSSIAEDLTDSYFDDKGQLRKRTYASFGITLSEEIYEYDDSKLVKVTSSKKDEHSEQSNREFLKIGYDDKDNVISYTKIIDDITCFSKDFNYDNKNRLCLEYNFYSNDEIKIEYLYNNDNNINSINFVDKFSVNYDYDELNRIKHQSIEISKNSVNPYQKIEICHEYNYLQQDENSLNLIAEDRAKIIIINNSTFDYDKLVPVMVYMTETSKYTYDVNGNIIEIDTDDSLTRYQYDKLNRLVREDNPKFNKTFVYKYDSAGNVILKKTYNYTLDDKLYSPRVDEFTYECNGWNDQLIFFNGNLCEYDELGRPIIYKNNKLTWEANGNLLTFNQTKFSYDANGIRQKKIVNGVETKFIVDGTKILQQITKNITLTFRYALNKLVGFQYNDSDKNITQEYYYLRNIQGDIISIINEEGKEVGGYAYDAYGNHIIISDTNSIASINPFRYRGYYFDSETNLFYCNSRYYDPETGRWISPDTLSILDETKGQINGLNLYMYCNNNPVMYVDPTGYSWESFWNDAGNWFSNHWQELLIGTAFIVVGALVTALTAGTGVGFMAAFGSALLSSTIQVGISVGTSVLIGGLISVANGGDFFDNVGDNIASAYMWGGIFSGGAQILGGGFRIAANKGVTTGRAGGIKLGNSGVKILSPDKNNWAKAGGTLIKFGNALRFDTGALWGLHMHILSSGHLPIGAIIAGLLGIV